MEDLETPVWTPDSPLTDRQIDQVCFRLLFFSFQMRCRICERGCVRSSVRRSVHHESNFRTGIRQNSKRNVKLCHLKGNQTFDVSRSLDLFLPFLSPFSPFSCLNDLLFRHPRHKCDRLQSFSWFSPVHGDRSVGGYLRACAGLHIYRAPAFASHVRCRCFARHHAPARHGRAAQAQLRRFQGHLFAGSFRRTRSLSASLDDFDCQRSFLSCFYFGQPVAILTMKVGLL